MRGDRDEKALKPIGAACVAVLAGLAGAAAERQAAGAPAAPTIEPTASTRAHYVDPTNHAGFDEDPAMIVGPSDPVAPFADPAPAPKARQGDLFDL